MTRQCMLQIPPLPGGLIEGGGLLATQNIYMGAYSRVGAKSRIYGNDVITVGSK